VKVVLWKQAEEIAEEGKITEKYGIHGPINWEESERCID